MSWRYVTPEGHQSMAYRDRAQAVRRAVVFHQVREMAKLGIHGDFFEPDQTKADACFAELEEAGWRVEGTLDEDEALIREATCGMWTGSDA